MAKKIKISRKQIKKPDEFISWSEQAWNWFQEHVWETLGIIAGFIVLVLAVQGGSGWLKSRTTQSAIEFGKSMEILRADVSGTSQPQGFFTTSNYSSESEKYRAALSSFESIINNYSKSMEAELSLLYAGRLNEKLEDYNKAIDYYNKFLTTKAAATGQELAASSQLGVGRCYFSMQQYEKAIEFLDKAIESKTIYSPEAMLFAARSYYFSGKPEKGKELLQMLKKDYPESKSAQYADFLARYLPKHSSEIKKGQPIDASSENKEMIKLESELGTGNTAFELPK